MKENIVLEKSYEFALDIIYLFKDLTENKREYIMSKQILKSGTSIGANMHEADAAISRADFSAKVSIAYKEARETQFWLRLLFDSGYLDEEIYNSLNSKNTELCKILFAILRTTGRIRKKEQ